MIFKIDKEIGRYELPSLERSGCLAQTIPSKFPIFAEMGKGTVSYFGNSGLPIEEICFQEVCPGINATIIGFSALNKFIMVDIWNSENDKTKNLPLTKRLQVLNQVRGYMPEEAKKFFEVAKCFNNNFIQEFDKARKDGWYGLLIRSLKKPKTYIATCTNTAKNSR